MTTGSCPTVQWIEQHCSCVYSAKWMHWSAEPSPLHVCICLMHVYSMAHYVWFSIWSIELHVHTLHLNRVLVLFSVHDKSWSRERHLAMSVYKLNYALQSHWLFTLSLRWQLQSVICSWGRCHVNTVWPLFLCASNAYFLSDDPYHLSQEGSDGWIDGQKLPNDCTNPLPTLCGEG